MCQVQLKCLVKDIIKDKILSRYGTQVRRWCLYASEFIVLNYNLEELLESHWHTENVRWLQTNK